MKQIGSEARSPETGEMTENDEQREVGKRTWFAAEYFEQLDCDAGKLRRYVIAILDWLESRGQLTADGQRYLDELRSQDERPHGELSSDIFLHSDFVSHESGEFFDLVSPDLQAPFLGQLEKGIEPDVGEIHEELDKYWAQYEAGELRAPSLGQRILRGLGMALLFIAMIAVAIALFVGTIASGMWLGDNLAWLGAVTGLTGVGVGVLARLRPQLPWIDLLGWCGWAHAAGVALGLLLP